jgi:hypothetical protein
MARSNDNAAMDRSLTVKFRDINSWEMEGLCLSWSCCVIVVVVGRLCCEYQYAILF